MTIFKKVWIASVTFSFMIALVVSGNSADGASTSVASQISALQKKIILLQGRINTLENTPAGLQLSDLPTLDIYFYTLNDACKAPAVVVTTVPMPFSVLCHLEVVSLARR